MHTFPKERSTDRPNDREQASKRASEREKESASRKETCECFILNGLTIYVFLSILHNFAHQRKISAAHTNTHIHTHTVRIKSIENHKSEVRLSMSKNTKIEASKWMSHSRAREQWIGVCMNYYNRLNWLNEFEKLWASSGCFSLALQLALPLPATKYNLRIQSGADLQSQFLGPFPSFFGRNANHNEVVRKSSNGGTAKMAKL